VKRWCLFGEHSDGNDVAAWLAQTSLVEGSKATTESTISTVSASDAFLHGVFTQGTFEELNDIKERLIREVLKKYHGNKTKAAQHLGISYPGLLKMLKAMNGGNAEEIVE
jgi:transcriptional regulator with AAA-type ATPase domain